MNSSKIIQKIALGSVQFGLDYGISNITGQVKYNEVVEILQLANKSGMDTIDTAITYGDSEKVLGEIGIHDWKIISKLSALPEDKNDINAWVNAQVSGSLQRLGINQLYGLMLHRPDQLFESRGKELYRALITQQEHSEVNKIGVSIYSPDELERLFDEMHFDIVQAPFSILDQRLIDSGWARRLKQQGVELHVRSIFLQGLLLMPASLRPVKFGRWQNVWQEWDRWLDESSLTPLEACLRYITTIKEIDKVVIGVDSLEQLRQILAISSTPLTSLPNWPNDIDVSLLNPARWDQL